MSNIVNQEYWDSHYRQLTFFKALDNDPIRLLIQKHLGNRRVTQKDCIEIGCYPGQYLTIFGDCGYRLSGIDLTPNVDTELPGWLTREHYSTGEFLRGDFTKLDAGKKYDIVCSFGFIEHFTDWEAILEKHRDMVKEGGYLIVTAPNFRGPVQKYLHLLLDRRNYDRHVTESMKPGEWASLLGPEFTIVYSGYFGGFLFWVDLADRRNILEDLTGRAIWELSRRFGKYLPDSPLYSPYCGIIAKKGP